VSEVKFDNKRVFKVEVDGKDIELAVKRPDLKTQQQGQIVYSGEFCRLVRPNPDTGEPNAITRPALENVLRKQGLWDDAKQAKWDSLNESLLQTEKKLAKGGIKLSEARELAVQMRRDRFELRQLLIDRNSLDINTAEAQAEQARFNYYVSSCTVYTDGGKPFFKSVEDYVNRAVEPAAQKAAQTLGQLLYGLDDNFEAGLPENKFLLKYGFAREGDLHLIDPKTKDLVDAKGRRVDEKGRLINEKGELVDDEGNLLTESGEYKVDFVEFIDDLNAA